MTEKFKEFYGDRHNSFLLLFSATREARLIGQKYASLDFKSVERRISKDIYKKLWHASKIQIKCYRVKL